MAVSFVSVISERELFGNPNQNLVAFATGPDVLSVHADLVAAADIIQARYLYASFLLEVSIEDTRQDIEKIDGAFAVDSDFNLFCVPFSKRLRMEDADYAMSNFGTFCKLFDALRGESDVDLDDIWEDYFDTQGLICFRLVLGQK